MGNYFPSYCLRVGSIALGSVPHISRLNVVPVPPIKSTATRFFFPHSVFNSPKSPFIQSLPLRSLLHMSASPIYLIPPYLLHTCIGLQFQRELSQFDPILGERNTISPHLGQHYFRQPRSLPLTSKTFCNDPQINLLIRKKLLEQFAALGILGSSPSKDVPDDYLYEMYTTFKSRLGMSSGDSLLDSDTSALASDSTGHGSPVALKPKKSVFEIPRLGEVILAPSQLKTVSSALENYSLEALMEWVKESNENKYSFLPYLMIDGQKSFLTPFPMYWTPLAVDADLEYLDNTLGMDINFEDGYSNLDFKLSLDGFVYQNPAQKKRFFNFIANKEIEERTGVYYYEVSVEQTAPNATDFKPLIHLNDTSISSDSSLFFSMGFTKRYVLIEKTPHSPGVTTSIPGSVHSIDLRNVQSDISYYNQDVSRKAFDSSTLKFLGSEPGVTFEGSFAVSFNNSCSYASVKSGADNLRDPANNINRRFSQLGRHSDTAPLSTNLGMEVPLGNHSKSRTATKVCYKTDTLGCGVNFIDKTLLITLNGIHVKTITEEELIGSNVHGDSMFGKDGNVLSLFPIIGFQLGDFSSRGASRDTSTSRITTNFGLKEFKFNIERYVASLKEKQKLALGSSISGELQKVAINDNALQNTKSTQFEKMVCNLKNDSSLLNDLISGYLVREGYLETLSSFDSDLKDLERNLSRQPQDIDMSEQNDDKSSFLFSLENSAAHSRQKLKSLISGAQFIEAGKYLRSEFPEFEDAKYYASKLDLLHYVGLLQTFIRVKFDEANLAKSESCFNQAVTFGKYLFEIMEGDEDSQSFGQLSSVLLMGKREELQQLPKAKSCIEHFSEKILELSNQINGAILKHKGFRDESKLETMILSAGQNITSLCLANDDMFKMVNYERDYIDF